jgi:hypothetical protein
MTQQDETGPPGGPDGGRDEPGRARRSWYMTTASADELAGLVDDLHHETRVPRYAVLAEIVAVAVEHQEQVRARLAASGAGEETR